MLQAVPEYRREVAQSDLENIATWQSQIEHLEALKTRTAKRVIQQLADGARVEPGSRHATVEPMESCGVSYDVLRVDGRKCYIHVCGSLADVINALWGRFSG